MRGGAQRPGSRRSARPPSSDEPVVVILEVQPPAWPGSPELLAGLMLLEAREQRGFADPDRRVAARPLPGPRPHRFQAALEVAFGVFPRPIPAEDQLAGSYLKTPVLKLLQDTDARKPVEAPGQ